MMLITDKIKRVSIVFLSFAVFFVIGATLIFAQNIGGGNPTIGGGNPTDGTTDVVVKLDNPFAKGGDSLFDFLKTIINDILLPIGGVLAVLAFIYSGFLYVTAQGNEGKLATAHKALLYTSIGTAVLLGSWVIAQVIETTVNQLK